MNIDKDSIVSDDGKTLFFSVAEFCKKFSNNNCCFICGKTENDLEFNDEHIIPRWILRRYNLFNDTITLPNTKDFRYSKYTLKCCKECNSLLGKKIEDVICSGISDDYYSSMKFIQENYKIIFIWMSLLFIKTHFRDKYFSFNFTDDTLIGDLYNWETLHHLHCISRSPYTGIEIDESVIGSIFVFPCIKQDQHTSFDYIDIYRTHTTCIKLGCICIICVLNDSGIVKHILADNLKGINGPINSVQLRELFTRIAYQNTLIMDRPKYYTGVYMNPGKLKIDSIIKSEIRVKDLNNEEFGNFFYEMIQDCFFDTNSPEGMKQIELIKKGVWTYIYDANGNFIQNTRTP